MKSFIELAGNDPDFFKRSPDLLEYWEKVQAQAARHMRRMAQNDLFDIDRPNDSPEIKTYRDDVRRDITWDGTYGWLSMVSRIFIEHGIAIDESSLSDLLRLWIQNGPFQIAGKPVDINSFMYELLLPMSVEDPNAALVPLPINPADPKMPPAESQSGTDRVGVLNVLIPSGRIRYLTNYVFAWEAGKWRMTNNAVAPYFFATDLEWFYRYVPVHENGKTEYVVQPWYNHNTGMLMVNQLGGSIARPGDKEHYSETTDDLYHNSVYYESFLRPYFELADEVVTAFSDNQGVRLLHNSPKLIMAKIPCMNNCSNGWIIDRETHTRSECPDCGGSGYIKNPGAYSIIVRPDDDIPGGSKPVMEYVAPPSANLEISYNTVWDLYMKAKRTIGLDLLENLAESGVAKEHRLAALNDMLRKVSASFFGLVSRHLLLVESLLVPDDKARKTPLIKMPTDLQYKPEEVLKDAAEKALPNDRFQSQMDYYRKKYVNDPAIVKIHRLSLTWAPILLSTQEEVSASIAYGIYTDEDLIKRDRAFLIFKEISKSMQPEKFLLEDDKVLIDKADQMLPAYLPARASLRTPPPINTPN